MKTLTNKKHSVLGLLILFLASFYFLSGTQPVSVFSEYSILPAIDTTQLQRVGSSVFIEDSTVICSSNDICVEFTPDQNNQVGATWYTEVLNLSKGFSFTICLNLGGNDINGGEGLTLILQNSPDTTMAIGTSGNTLGYDNIAPSVGISFDTHYDPDLNDIVVDHISLDTNGYVLNPITTPISIIPEYGLPGSTNLNVEDDNFYEVTITWDPVNNYLQVFHDEKLRVGYQEDFRNTIFDNDSIYIGATASTGSAVSNLQKICLQNQPSNFNTQESGCLTGQNVDYRLWYQTGHPDNGHWFTSNVNLALRQGENINKPSFRVTPYDLINVEMEFIVNITDTIGNGNIGFGVGYDKPFGDNHNQFNTLLFNWKKQTSPLSCNPSINVPAGFTLAKLDGDIPPGCNTGEEQYHFEGQQPGPNYNILATKYHDTLGWTPNTNYQFKLIYTLSELTILLEKGTGYDTIFHLENQCFEPGRFGPFTFAQPGLKFFNFSYKYLADFIVQEEEVCFGEESNFLFMDQCSNNFNFNLIDSIIWDFGDGSPTININPANNQNLNQSHIYQFADTFTVGLRVKNALGCWGDIEKQVIVKPLPIINLGPDITLCDGETFTLYAGVDNDSCRWNTGDTTKSILVNSPGPYSVTSYLDGCSHTSNLINISYNTPLFNFPSEITSTCSQENDGSITFYIDGGTPPYRYYINGIEYPGPVIGNLAFGNYTVLIQDSFDCTLVLSETIQSLNNFEEQQLDIYDISCFEETDGSIEFFDSNNLLLYSLDGTTFQNEPFFNNLAEGFYTLFIQDTFNCISLIDFEIEDPGLLTLELPPNITIELGDTIQITSTSNGISLSYAWEDSPWIDCLQCAHPSVFPLFDTPYTLIITNPNGCTATDSIIVFVQKDYQIFIPNIFTPNNDGYNDLFMIQSGEAIKKINIIKKLQIFERWGEAVFHLENFLPDDFNSAWNGTLRGKPCLQGVYPYILEIEYIDGHHEFITGNITLIR